jgi:hypothetical protein
MGELSPRALGGLPRDSNRFASVAQGQRRERVMR